MPEPTSGRKFGDIQTEMCGKEAAKSALRQFDGMHLLPVVSPGGTNALIMSHAGGSGYAVTNLVLTFDDAATNSLPSTGAITTGTYKPTYYSPPLKFP